MSIVLCFCTAYKMLTIYIYPHYITQGTARRQPATHSVFYRCKVSVTYLLIHAAVHSLVLHNQLGIRNPKRESLHDYFTVTMETVHTGDFISTN